MQSQKPNTFWCWAAVASSIDHFYSPSSFIRQCAVSQLVHGHAMCCNVPTPDTCDQPNSLTTALTQIRHFRERTMCPIAFANLQAEINNGRVVAAFVEWFGSGGHFVVISGYGITASGEPWLVIEDPLFGQDIMPYSEFCGAYRGQGRWSCAYYLAP